MLYRLAAFHRYGCAYLALSDRPILGALAHALLGYCFFGHGVTLINRGLMTEDQSEWREARAFRLMPRVKFIIRAARLISERLSGAL